jgi:signal transduction histidine kinase
VRHKGANRQPDRQRAETRQLQRELARSRNLLRALFDGLDDGLALLDAAGAILAINRPLSAILARPPEALVGRLWASACTEIVPHFPAGWVADTLLDGAARHDHARHAARIYQVSTVPLHEAGRIDQLIVRVVDITRQLNIEALLVEQERFAASGRLAMIVAHEVNTPLQSIESSLHLAAAGGETGSTYLAHAREATRRAGSILHQLVELYHPEAQRVRQLDINALLRRVLLLTSGSLARRGIRVDADLVPAAPMLTLRSDGLTQMVTSLILLVADALPDGGTLCVRTRSGVEYIAVSFEAAAGGISFDEIAIEHGYELPGGLAPSLSLAAARHVAQCLGGRIVSYSDATTAGLELALPTGA